MSKACPTIVLIGAGGYGEVYLGALLDELPVDRCRLVAVVDPQPDRCGRSDEIRARNIPVFSNLDQFYRHDRAALAVIASPIQHHCEQTCLAVRNGSDTVVVRRRPVGSNSLMITASASSAFLHAYTWTLASLRTTPAAGFGPPPGVK